MEDFNLERELEKELNNVVLTEKDWDSFSSSSESEFSDNFDKFEDNLSKEIEGAWSLYLNSVEAGHELAANFEADFQETLNIANSIDLPTTAITPVVSKKDEDSLSDGDLEFEEKTEYKAPIQIKSNQEDDFEAVLIQKKKQREAELQEFKSIQAKIRERQHEEQIKDEILAKERLERIQKLRDEELQRIEEERIEELKRKEDEKLKEAERARKRLELEKRLENEEEKSRILQLKREQQCKDIRKKIMEEEIKKQEELLQQKRSREAQLKMEEETRIRMREQHRRRLLEARELERQRTEYLAQQEEEARRKREREAEERQKKAMSVAGSPAAVRPAAAEVVLRRFAACAGPLLPHSMLLSLHRAVQAVLRQFAREDAVVSANSLEEVLKSESESTVFWKSDLGHTVQAWEDWFDSYHRPAQPAAPQRRVLTASTKALTDGYETVSSLQVGSLSTKHASFSLGCFSVATPSIIPSSDEASDFSSEISLLHRCKHLHSLSIYSSDLSRFPSNLPPSITALYLDNNHLEGALTLPSLPFLQVLSLTHNEITSLTLSMETASSLQFLDVGFNQFSSLLFCFEIINLHYLNAQSNRIQSFAMLPSKLNALAILVLSRNQLKFDSADHSETGSNECLLPSFPLLIHLDISFNCLDYLPKNVFSTSPLLHSVNLQGNRIQSLESIGWLPLLISLDLRDNCLSALPLYIHCYPLLRTMLLDGNAFEFMQAFVSKDDPTFHSSMASLTDEICGFYGLLAPDNGSLWSNSVLEVISFSSDIVVTLNLPKTKPSEDADASNIAVREAGIFYQLSCLLQQLHQQFSDLLKHFQEVMSLICSNTSAEPCDGILPPVYSSLHPPSRYPVWGPTFQTFRSLWASPAPAQHALALLAAALHTHGHMAAFCLASFDTTTLTQKRPLPVYATANSLHQHALNIVRRRRFKLLKGAIKERAARVLQTHIKNWFAARTHAAVSIQKRFRGYFLRKRIQMAIANTKLMDADDFDYGDVDIDELLDFLPDLVAEDNAVFAADSIYLPDNALLEFNEDKEEEPDVEYYSEVQPEEAQLYSETHVYFPKLQTFEDSYENEQESTLPEVDNTFSDGNLAPPPVSLSMSSAEAAFDNGDSQSLNSTRTSIVTEELDQEPSPPVDPHLSRREEKISEEWGFKNAKTASLMKKKQDRIRKMARARNRREKGTASQRYELFKKQSHLDH
eukprot:GCRY01004500.1.p1 GENE.GCRY01004500.1~~GCRY01004500.1.p1  ORF type:complete len:1200 (+),score=253.09 GCRY01004500.1:192-3791(+)